MKFLKKIKWVIWSLLIVVILGIIISCFTFGVNMILLLEIIGVLGILGILGYCFIMCFKYWMQPKRVFFIEVESKIISPIFSFNRYTLEYFIYVKSIEKKEENVIYEKTNKIKIKKQDKEKPVDYLENLLKIEIAAVEKMLRENYSNCNAFKTYKL